MKAQKNIHYFKSPMVLPSGGPRSLRSLGIVKIEVRDGNKTHVEYCDYPARNLKAATEPLASEQFAKAHMPRPKKKK